MSEDAILIETSIDDDGFPGVSMTFEGHTQTRSAEEFRSFAIALLTAGAIAQNEVAIYDGLRSIDEPYKAKGFKKEQSAVNDSMPAKMLMILREFRPEMPFNIHAFRGLNTGEALISYPWPSRPTGLQLDTTRLTHLAKNILAAVEAAETDASLRHFTMFQLESTPEAAELMIAEFREFRVRIDLENALRNS